MWEVPQGLPVWNWIGPVYTGDTIMASVACWGARSATLRSRTFAPPFSAPSAAGERRPRHAGVVLLVGLLTSSQQSDGAAPRNVRRRAKPHSSVLSRPSGSEIR